MKKEEFEQQLNALIPRPSQEANTDLYKTGLEILGRSGPTDIVNAFDFIARHFYEDVLQNVYEITQCGPAVLPGEMVTAAVFLQAGDAPDDIVKLVKSGYLKSLYSPTEKGEISTLASCIFIEDGKLHGTYTTHFGSFQPEQIFSDAKKYAEQQGITVMEAFHAAVESAATNHWPDMAEALSDIFACGPAVAARIIFDVDQDCVTVEYNPLWKELCQTQGQRNNEKRMKGADWRSPLDIKLLPFHNEFGDHELTVTVSSYAQNGRLAVTLLSKVDDFWQPYAFLTVNLPQAPLKVNEAFIKDFNENAGFLEFLLENKLGTLCPERGHSGSCSYPKIAFDMEKLREFDPEGVQKYLRQAQQKKRPPKRKER